MYKDQVSPANCDYNTFSNDLNKFTAVSKTSTSAGAERDRQTTVYRGTYNDLQSKDTFKLSLGDCLSTQRSVQNYLLNKDTSLKF